jgi:hypothetical protein
MLKRNEGGSIINIGSVNGLYGIGEEAYAAAKAGVVNLVSCLHFEFPVLGYLILISRRRLKILRSDTAPTRSELIVFVLELSIHLFGRTDWLKIRRFIKSWQNTIRSAG